MKTIAIIAEYNPFHNGHLYHLQQSMDLTDANRSVSIMSGNFLQRGEPAMWDKYTRAKMCVSSGIDLAIELPTCYAIGSAHDFAYGAVNILNNLNTIDYLCFGAETPDIHYIEKIADTLLEEPDEYKNILKTQLSCGESYPAARNIALKQYINNSEITDILSLPNNILAIEYVSALKHTNSTIKPIIIKRINNSYHDHNLTGNISSATAIRHSITNITRNKNYSNEELQSLLTHNVPLVVSNIIEKKLFINSPIYTDYLTPFLQSKLLDMNECNNICDISNDIANKIKKLQTTISYKEALETLKSKDITMSRVSRCLMHLILNYTETMRYEFSNSGYAFYANVLSFKKIHSDILKCINNNSAIPLITKKADFTEYIKVLDPKKQITANKMWQLDLKATNLYNTLIFNKYNYIAYNDLTTQIPII